MDSKVGNCNDVAAGQCQIEEENSEDERWDEEKDVDDINSCGDLIFPD